MIGSKRVPFVDFWDGRDEMFAGHFDPTRTTRYSLSFSLNESFSCAACTNMIDELAYIWKIDLVFVCL